MRHECSVQLESCTPVVDCCTLILGELSTILFYLKIDWYVCIANLSTALFQHVDAASCGLRCNCPTHVS